MKQGKRFVMLSAIILSLTAAADVTLVRNGKPESVIVLDEKPTMSAQMGAYELQHHVKLITGAELPIVKGKVPEGKLRIKIGGENEEEQEESTIIKFRKGEILLTGGDTKDYSKVDYKKLNTFPPIDYHWKGSLFAVYDFLNDYCDVHFYGMDPLDTTYKKRSTLTVKEKDRRFVSKMDAFRDAYDDFYPKGHLVKKSNRDHALWKLRWRCSVTYAKTNHNTSSIYFAHWDKAKDKYQEKAFKGKRHELFAQGYEGKAATCGPFLEKRYPGDINLPPQLCYTNPGTIDFYAREALTYYQGGNAIGGWKNLYGNIPVTKTLMPKFPGKPYFYPYEGNDSGMFCLCKNCQKLATRDNFSETKFRFLNATAKRVRELDPKANAGISTLAYGSTLPCPKDLTLEPNTSVELCIVNYAWWHPVVNRKNKENFEQWVKVMGDRPLTLWLYVYGPQHDASIHYGNYKPFPAFYPWKMGEQMKCFIKNNVKGIFSEYKMPYNFLEAYIVSKLSYDTSLDPNKVIDKYFTDYYGAAGPSMKAIYRDIENAMRDPEFTPKDWRKNPNTAYIDNGRVISPWWPTSMWSREINFKLGSPERIARIEKLLAQAKKKVSTPEEKERLKRFIDAVWTPAVQGRREYELYLKQKEIPPRTFTLTSIPDGANGDPQKIDWSKTTVSEKWLDPNGKDIWSTAKINLAVDSKYFYFRFEEERPPVLSYGLWTENVEFFFTPDGKYPLYHFAHGPKVGTKATGIYKDVINDSVQEKDYDFQANTVSIPTEKNWILFGAIPRKKLPIRNNTMKMDFFRMRHDGKKWHVSCWQPVYTISGGKGMDSYGQLFILPYTVQQNDMKRLWEGSGTGIINDPEAVDGKAAYMIGKLSWYLSYPIPKSFIHEKVDVYARVRIEAEHADYLTMVCHDWKAKKGVFYCKIPAKEINGKKYAEFKIGSAELNENQSIYVGSIYYQGKWHKNSNDRIFVDYLRFEKAKPSKKDK